MSLSLAAAAALLCAFLCPGFGARAQTAQTADPYAARLREFEEFAAAGIKRDRIPGMTVGFFKDDYTWVKGFGYADLENRTPAIAESAYRLASITKSMTGEAVVQLAERGKLDLDAEIQRYVPDYPVQQWPVTVRHLLTHTGGGQVGSGLGPEHVSTKEVVARISKYPIKYETGLRFDYQTSGYNLLGAAIENVSGKSFDAYLRENLFAPAGMKDTGMDDVVNLVPNRVRGYELVNGEIKNAPFIDVSSRFGGGGLTGTVPDLLRWARASLSGKIVSAKWADEMLKPFTSKSGRYTGLGDGDTYYTLGWMVQPVNGNFAIFAGGSQKGTEALLYYFPEKRLGLAVACNRQFAPTGRYVSRLYELVTGEPWEAKVYTRDRADVPLALALNTAFNYGALDFEQHRRPATSDVNELAAAFDFFNKSVSREAVRADFAAASKRIRDARHPVGNVNLIKLGSYIAARLKGQNGAAGLDRYHTSGAVPFFADYVRLYKSDPKTPTSLRFTPEFEKLIARWDADWARTWNDYTRRLTIAPDTDFDTVGARLRREFAGAEVYPDFTSGIQPIQQGLEAFKAQKLGADLYPYSDEILFNWGYFIILGEMSPEGRAALKGVAGEYERPLAYFRRAHEANPDGVMRAGTFLDLGGRWLNRPPFYDAAVEFVGAGVALHPKNAKLRELLGDFFARKGSRELAAEHYRAAYNIDPALAKGLSADDYVAQRLKAAGEKKD